MKLFAELFDGGRNFLISTQTPGITNSKSKECGSFHLRKVIPKMACYKANTEVCLISWFGLVSTNLITFLQGTFQLSTLWYEHF